MKKLLAETDGTDVTQKLYTFTEGVLFNRSGGDFEEEYGDLVSQFDGVDSGYPMFDAQWSTGALVDDSEDATDRWRYRAFGLQTHEQGSSDTPFTFVGKQGYYHDPELDLYFLGMAAAGAPEATSRNAPSEAGREYDPATGQFVSTDPVRDDENAYRYVGNNPVNVIDPKGQEPIPEPFIVTDEVRREYRESVARANRARNEQERRQIIEVERKLDENPNDEDLVLTHLALSSGTYPTDPDAIRFDYVKALKSYYRSFGIRPSNFPKAQIWRFFYTIDGKIPSISATGTNYRREDRYVRPWRGRPGEYLGSVTVGPYSYPDDTTLDKMRRSRAYNKVSSEVNSKIRRLADRAIAH